MKRNLTDTVVVHAKVNGKKEQWIGTRRTALEERVYLHLTKDEFKEISGLAYQITVPLTEKEGHISKDENA